MGSDEPLMEHVDALSFLLGMAYGASGTLLIAFSAVLAFRRRRVREH